MPFCNSCGEPIRGTACVCGSKEIAPPSGLDTGVDRSMTFVPGASSRRLEEVHKESHLALVAGLDDRIETKLSSYMGTAPQVKQATAFNSSAGGSVAFGTTCHLCKEPLNISDDCVSSLDQVYHARCLVCSECALPVSGTITERQGKLLCKGCDARLVKEKTMRLNEIKAQEKAREEMKRGVETSEHLNEPCSACGEALGTEEGHRINDLVYHTRCFTCSACSRSIGTALFKAVQGKPFHAECAPGARAGGSGAGASVGAGGKICPKCRKAITTKFVSFNGEELHSECFTCSDCNGSMAKGFAMLEGKPTCAECVRKPRSLGSAITGQRHKGFVIDPITGQKKTM